MSIFNRLTDESIYQTKCFQTDAGRMPYRPSVRPNDIDIENDLRGQNVILSRYGETRIRETPDVTAEVYSECSFVPEYTRFNKPCLVRGTYINRFDPLCQDYQANAFYSNDIAGINSRLAAKDSKVLDRE
jgi:hypothetical protein